MTEPTNVTITDKRTADGRAATSAVGQGQGAPPGGPARSRRRGRWLALTAAVAVAAGAGWTVATTTRSGDGGATQPTIATKLADVTRRDLTETKEVEGTLTYEDATTVSGRLMGTVTAMAAEGNTVKRGGKLYEVDGRPVRLLYGTRPAWRDLRVGDEGADVLQLERNLDALGYTDAWDVTVDDEFTAATREAVEDWQEDAGMVSDGVVNLGEVVFEPGQVRVGSHTAAVGGGAQGGIMQVSSSKRVVSVDLETSDQGDVKVGDAVTVELPDGTETGGKVTSVGRVAESSSDSSDDPNAEDTGATIKVEVTLDDPTAAGSLDQAPVQVSIVTDSAKGALTVPVNALIALAEGGYAVEVDEGGRRHLVPVETGMFADGRVEISGGVAEGAKVVVPA